MIPAGFFYSIFFFNRGHHGPNIIHQNDEIKSLDFGEYQLSTTVDRVEANFNTITSLTCFGEQVLHHLFPTLDNAILPHLKETLVQTCKEFDIDKPGDVTVLNDIWGQLKQLYRSETIRCT